MFDVRPLSLSTFHKISAHIYNNAMVLNAEKMILKLVDYNLFVRDILYVDRIGLYLESIRFLIAEQDFERFKE